MGSCHRYVRNLTSAALVAVGLTLLGVVPALASSAVFSGVTKTFPYRQKKFLFSRQGPGALVHVPDAAAEGEVLPVLVFLHGQNAEQHMHPRFDGTPGDLRKIAAELTASGKTRPFLVAAPTHTRYATGATVMWPTFDVGHFLDATDAALAGRAKVDRRHVVVVGHSAAGCNADEGLFAAARFSGVKAVVGVDTCLTEPIRDAYLSLARKADVRIFWHASWAGRPFGDLASACAAPGLACKVTEVTNLVPADGHPHDAILGEALRRALPELFPKAPKPPPSPAEGPATTAALAAKTK